MIRDDLILRGREIIRDLIQENPEWTEVLSGISIKWSNRFVTTLGQVTYLRRSGPPVQVTDKVVTLNGRFFDKVENHREFEDTFTHELAHIVDASMSSRSKRRHSYRWKAIHQKMGGSGQARASNKGVVIVRQKAKRLIRFECDACGHVLEMTGWKLGAIGWPKGPRRIRKEPVNWAPLEHARVNTGQGYNSCDGVFIPKERIRPS